jgi:hypothetical protein
MPDKMYLIVTLRKEVLNKVSAKTMVEVVKNKLIDHPEINITAHTTDHFDMKEVI